LGVIHIQAMGIHIMILIMDMVCMGTITEAIIHTTAEVITVGTTVVIMVVFMVDLVYTVHSDITGGIIITATEIKVQYMEDTKDPVPCHPDGIALLAE
jgi:hypothetical protein